MPIYDRNSVLELFKWQDRVFPKYQGTVWPTWSLRAPVSSWGQWVRVAGLGTVSPLADTLVCPFNKGQDAPLSGISPYAWTGLQ